MKYFLKQIYKKDTLTYDRFGTGTFQKFDQVEYLIGYEGDAFAFTNKLEEDLLSIALHRCIPCGRVR
jgi:hypothetical protein